MTKRWRRWGGRALLGLGVAIVAEGVSMIWLPVPPVDRRPTPKVEPHEGVGYRMIPNQDAFSYQARVTTNSIGIRDREISEDLLNAPIVLFVGGSETFGKGVEVDAAFPRRLEARLASVRPEGWRVLNAGTPDWNLDQSLAFVRQSGDRLHPRIVILSLYWDDLFYDPSIEGSPTLGRDGGAQRGEWFVRRWARDVGALDWIAPIYTRSRLLYAGRNLAKQWWGRRQAHPAVVWRQALLDGTSTADLDAAWHRAQDNLRLFQRMSVERGFTAAVLVLPMEQQILEPHPKAAFATKAASMARTAGLHVIDGVSEFADDPDPESLFIPYDGRPSAQGHDRLARALAKWMQAHQQMP